MSDDFCAVFMFGGSSHEGYYGSRCYNRTLRTSYCFSTLGTETEQEVNNFKETHGRFFKKRNQQTSLKSEVSQQLLQVPAPKGPTQDHDSAPPVSPA